MAWRRQTSRAVEAIGGEPMKQFAGGEESVSVSFEANSASDWRLRVGLPHIRGPWGSPYRKPS